jgi:hypothetical protein
MKIISGGQTGADLAGLDVAKDLGIKTGGWAPKGWKTSIGPQQKLLKSHGLIESIDGYSGRTIQNVKDSNATIRLAIDFNTPGELCTLQAINSCKKPWIDVDLLNQRPIKDIIDFLVMVKPSILNIAGNTQDTKGHDIHRMTYMYLRKVFSEYKRIYLK